MDETGDGELTMTEVARKFGVSYPTIKRKVAAGILPIARKAPNGVVFLRPADIDPELLAHARRLAASRFATRQAKAVADPDLRTQVKQLATRVAALERALRKLRMRDV